MHALRPRQRCQAHAVLLRATRRLTRRAASSERCAAAHAYTDAVAAHGTAGDGTFVRASACCTSVAATGGPAGP